MSVNGCIIMCFVDPTEPTNHLRRRLSTAEAQLDETIEIKFGIQFRWKGVLVAPSENTDPRNVKFAVKK